MPSGFVVYNYKKKEVVFAHRLFTPEQTKKGRYLWGNTTRIPFYNNGLIFVHDNCDALHIFRGCKRVTTSPLFGSAEFPNSAASINASL